MGVVNPDTDKRNAWVDAIFDQYATGKLPRQEYEKLLFNVISYPLDEKSKKEIENNQKTK